MEIKILGERPNPLLQRTEYSFEVSHPTGPTPTRDAIRTELAKLTKVPKDRLIVENIRARFGTASAVGLAAGYQNAETLKRVVREHILVRNGLKEKTAKNPPPAAETPTPAAPTPPAAPPAKES